MGPVFDREVEQIGVGLGGLVRADQACVADHPGAHRRSASRAARINERWHLASDGWTQNAKVRVIRLRL